jgi:tRNA-splicing ligase RtcB (3'-phosphate/5'-hydroxy nucleic acid ligase)
MKKFGQNKNIPVWGDPVENAIEQMDNALHCGAFKAALMGDHHLGYSVPVGGVIAYENAISPSGVGFDIACGNKAILTDAHIDDIRGNLNSIMDLVARNISFGIGRVSNSKHISGQKDASDHNLFYNDAWNNIPMLGEIKDMARNQLGTVGSGNHYVDIFHDEKGRVWVGVHFGSRGLGHKIATHYIKAGGGTDGMFVNPVVLDTNTDLGKEYIAAMNLAGEYAYAGRDWVCNEVARILGANVLEEIHNHHNFAWLENHEGKDLWVVRKGATPAFPDQKGFVGGTMGENSVILKGVEHEECKLSLYSTVHGAGRVLSRNQAAGKCKWIKGKKTRVSEGLVSQQMMNEWISKKGVILRGAGVDESPHCYKRLDEVLEAHSNTIKIIHSLTPVGVVMAGEETFDPYKD